MVLGHSIRLIVEDSRFDIERAVGMEMRHSSRTDSTQVAYVRARGSLSGMKLLQSHMLVVAGLLGHRIFETF